jgi:hypothetical protein
MNPINGVRPGGPAGAVAPRNAARGGRFSVADQAAGGSAATATEAEEVAETSLAGLLALQEEVGGGQTRDREARRRGRDLLAELSALQRDLLAGPPDEARLSRLAGLAATLPEAADPRLREAVNAIALRARVEAARYGTG